jgi:hypothetical protein
MASFTTNTPKTSVFHLMSVCLRGLWAQLNPPVIGAPKPFNDPRDAQARRDRARAEVDLLMHRAH